MAWDPDLLIDRANQAFQECSSRDPRQFRWGFFAWADAPAACGGGVGAFQWFQAQDELLSHLVDFGPAAFMTFDEECQWNAMRDELRQIAASFSIDRANTLLQLNAHLKSLFQVDWIGEWDELCATNDEFPRRVRSNFRDNGEDDQSAECCQPIGIDEVDSFCEFIGVYGM